jgi:hypothetical protein
MSVRTMKKGPNCFWLLHISLFLTQFSYNFYYPYHESCLLHVPIVLKSGSLNLLEPSGPVKACNGIALPSPFTLIIRLFKEINLPTYGKDILRNWKGILFTLHFANNLILGVLF